MHVIHMHCGLSRFPRLVQAAFCAWAGGRVATAPARADDLEKAVFYLGWRAEPECGGFFQALNAGVYKKYGLDTERPDPWTV